MQRHFAALAILAVQFATPVLGAVDEVRVYVKGLACPFCVFGIEKNLKKLPGVTAVETTVRTGLVRLTIRPGTPIEPRRIQHAVSRSGFTLDWIEATLTGRLVTHEGRPALQAEPGAQVFLLVEGHGEEIPQELSDATHEKMKQASAGVARSLVVSGRVHGHDGMPPALAVESFEVAR